MDFFAQQDQARRKTKYLVIYFALAVISLIVLFYFASLVIFSGVQTHGHRFQNYGEPAPPFALWNPQIFLGVTLGVLAVVFIGSAYKTMALADGGSAVAESLGGHLVSPNTLDPDERKLLNVVEEMSIASGVPMPKVYVLDGEQAINAFAAGHTTGDAAIGVTRGCIKMLSRDELQGVIGHEFSHILNGDMKINIRLIGIIFGLLCLATIGRILLNTRGGNSRDKNALPLFGLVLVILGAVGVFFGRLIQAAVSRQREFLADASSVQFTRNPGGLSGALKKIGRYEFGSHMESEHAPDVSHMFFGNALATPLFGALATHPPIPDRIRAIEPTWDGKFPELKPEQFATVKRAALDQLKPSPMPEILRNVIIGAGLSDEAPPIIRPTSVMPSIGNPSPQHLRYAEQLRESLSENVKAAARDPLDATALIYTMLLSADEKIRATQLAELAKQVAPAVHAKTVALFPDVVAAANHARLPLVNLALGALRNLDAAQFKQFSETMDWLIGSDGKVELFEFVLQKIIVRNLAPKFGGTRPATVQFYTLKPLVPDCAVVLSALAQVGSSEAGEIQKAFATGAPFLRGPADVPLELLPRENCDVEQLDAALNRLTLAVPIIKKNLIEASARVIGADGVILEAEAELLRAIADTLDCPIPPLGVNG
jgi:Zn-dependent protease with chaperone function/uncharacterized tellurite resistance protein B-like protein